MPENTPTDDTQASTLTNHERTCEEFRSGRPPATPSERAANYRSASETLLLLRPTHEEIASMLGQWADVQDAIADHVAVGVML